MISLKTNNFLDIIVRVIYYNYEQNITFMVKAMNGTEKVYALLKVRGGYLKTTEARGNGIDNKTMQRIADRGLIERIAHGLYVSSDILPDPFFFAQYGG